NPPDMLRLGSLRPGRAAAAAAVLLVALVGLVWEPPAAHAAVIGGATTTSSVSGGAWGVDPAPASVQSAPPCLTTPDACGPFGSSGSGPWYLNLWNTGTTNLTGLSYVISFSGGGNPKVSLDACSVAWSTGSGGSCAGTTTSILSRDAAGTYPVTVGI